MERLEYYRKLIEFVCEDPSVAALELATPSLADIKAGDIEAEWIDLGEFLPQLKQDELDRLLTRLSVTGAKAFAIISVYYSDNMLDSGSNLHATVQPQDWWKALFDRHFASSQFIRGHRDSEFVWTNFEIRASTRSMITGLGNMSSFRRELVRFADRVKLAWKCSTGGCVDRRELLSELRGKRIAVVGNARSLECGEFGAEIDAHDIIIRFNRVPIVSRVTHGYRTTWVATGVPITQRRMQSLGASHVLWLSPYRRKISGETIAVDRLYLHPLRDVRSLAERSGVTRPTTGLTAIDFLSATEVEQVSIYGFDFYQSQSSSSHQTIEAAPHQFDREELFIQALLQKDSRFVTRRVEPAALRRMH